MLFFIMILSLGREPWRLVEYQCGTYLVPLQGSFLMIVDIGWFGWGKNVVFWI